ncbi:GNAT family N-acetyltransferase [Nocardioides sp. Kera G14]|uniref:GNAT family N-acetyltransferase n=1 Tax=Nocardioides sp. Kera G14 TaxID=2884264 RepID=UPI001D0F959D|nr:GNAT family N-acetyltransferase [Nocardioides sp. Kera G14]UDY23710.1 N-acetyltransferase [Nocardioides sp. Kera G14]
MSEISYAHNPDERRYEILDGGRVIGFAQYVPAGEDRDFTHTEVDDAYEGQGLASQLVRFALDDVRTSGIRAIPHCPYVARWLHKHEGYEDITDWPS